MTEGEKSGRRRGLLLRLLVTGIVLALWFWTQSLIGARNAPPSGMGDALHDLTAGLNSYFARNAGAANALLIVSSGVIDALGFFLLGRWLFGGSVRPFLGLFLLMALRQVMQAICALPPPPNMIWHYPGFPSLLVTYHVANDFFFSGHTAICLVCAGIGLLLRQSCWSFSKSPRFSSCARTTPWTFLAGSSRPCGSPASVSAFLPASTA